MNMFAKAALSAALLIGTSLSAFAVERGGTLKYGRYADSLFLDPVLNDANVDIWILSNLYDTLILPSDDGKSLKPGLATQWKVSTDGLTVTLTLRDGIRFSDGSPITPADQAEAYFLLVSNRLSKTTGQVITVDGGLHEAFLR